MLSSWPIEDCLALPLARRRGGGELSLEGAAGRHRRSRIGSVSVKLRSMRQQNWQAGLTQNVSGGTAEHNLADPALGIGAL